MVDGYDELPVEYQEKVQFALENGHVPDDDWKGVVSGSCSDTDNIARSARTR